ncbi:MAG: VanZ family protein [Acidiferrobacterales bacterium]|nr:VanZ family protein [Acidiferrobacterales bacterium]
MITTLSLIPLPALPDVPGSDKTHHYLAYASLMFPVAIKRPKYWLWIGSFFVIWSGAIELLQPFVNRYAEWLDLLANVIGILIGILLASILRILVSYNND